TRGTRRTRSIDAAWSTSKPIKSARTIVPPAYEEVDAHRRQTSLRVDSRMSYSGSCAMRFPLKITDQFILEPILHVLGVKPDSSYVELGAGTLEVRMGGWFH